MVLGIPKKTIILVALLVGVVVVFAIGSDQESSGAEGGDSDACLVTVTADVLNVRAEPGTHSEIVGKYKHDSEAEATTVVRNGFRQLGENRWAHDDFLQPVDGAKCG
ncbi:SH3 domain-containing protein [Prauserella cavernicola]|uniref:SH3 domain-containing protein n=1 Tax=Prauserella cavernicola TaxID=2800127 RepID=A0A934V9G2_9PSEU|nr:SH3 domain-containing protein [Prauserella cavernicola]MBK1789310.1 SH3 domain-containing protein [Prauserella cavernicola]